MLLSASDERLSRESPARFRDSWVGVLGFSLAWSLLALGLWAVAWKVFGEPFGRILPAVLLTAVFALWSFRESLKSLAEIMFPNDTTSRAAVVSIFVLILTCALLSLPPDFYKRDPELPKFIAWFRPHAKIHRIIILAPLWGAWAMLITPQFRRPDDRTEPFVAAFARGFGPLAAAAVMGLLLGTTITYLNFLPWEQLIVSGLTVVGAIAAGLICCRLTGGLTRRALLAANIITQLVFILAYLGARNLLVWW
ncbi:MAG: hypothetical protein ACYSTL_00875 [Planctomycetota bacterium]|jgi:hypothetical protein